MWSTELRPSGSLVFRIPFLLECLCLGNAVVIYEKSRDTEGFAVFLLAAY